MTITDDRPTTTCPTWCRADHAADLQRRRDVAQDTARDLAAEGLCVEPVLDTYRLHRVEVGCVPVRVGPQERRDLLRVVLQQLETSTAAPAGPPGRACC